jgi:hypothetical protein
MQNTTFAAKMITILNAKKKDSPSEPTKPTPKKTKKKPTKKPKAEIEKQTMESVGKKEDEIVEKPNKVDTNSNGKYLFIFSYCLANVIMKDISEEGTSAEIVKPAITATDLKDLQWFENLREAMEIIDAIAAGNDFPTKFVYMALCELFVEPIIIESEHPYKATTKTLCHIPGAISLTITCDSKCSIYQNDMFMISSSDAPEVLGDLFSVTGTGDVRIHSRYSNSIKEFGKQFIINADKFWYHLNSEEST